MTTAGQRLEQIHHRLRQLAVTHPGWSRRLREIAVDVELLTDLVPRAMSAIHANLGTVDGWPTGNSDNPVHTSRSTSSTERAAVVRLAVHHGTIADLDATIAALQASVADLADQPDLDRADLDLLARIVGQVHQIIQRWLGQALTEQDRERMRCTGTGDQHGATCRQWAVKRGRCIDCHRRHEAKEKRRRRADTKTRVLAESE